MQVIVSVFASKVLRMTLDYVGATRSPLDVLTPEVPRG